VPIAAGRINFVPVETDWTIATRFCGGGMGVAFMPFHISKDDDCALKKEK
jgi:hypothetical protein